MFCFKLSMEAQLKSTAKLVKIMQPSFPGNNLTYPFNNQLLTRAPNSTIVSLAGTWVDPESKYHREVYEFKAEV